MRYVISVTPPANELAQEEIEKQVAFLSRDLRNIRFAEGGSSLEFDAPRELVQTIRTDIETLASRMAKALGNVKRTVVHSISEEPRFANPVDLSSAHTTGEGRVVLDGVSLRLLRYFDRAFELFGERWHAIPLLTPTLISASVLARCDYFRSFPQYVTFASHLRQDSRTLASFRSRHAAADLPDRDSAADLDQLDTCLSPAVCYHVYKLYEKRTLPEGGVVHSVCGRCFRFESHAMVDLRRLWEFTMREIVFLGDRSQVLDARERSIEMMARFLEEHRLAGEIRTASDPFFLAPDALAKAYYQLRSDSKFEVSLLLPGGERTAAGSHNYHADFFGRAFDTKACGGETMHSVCVAFGLERWVYAFLAQNGSSPSCWPDVINNAPEFADLR